MRVCYRSAKTGRFVSPAYAKKHPNTTVGETMRGEKPAGRSATTRLNKGAVHEI